MLAVVLSFSTVASIAQTIDVGPPDTSVCNGTPITLTAVLSGAGSGSALPATYNLTDDSHTGVVDMGFDFEYYGNVYNQCVISSNSYITFDLSGANGGSQWAINAAAPSPTFTTNNKIMFPWQDTNPGVSGTVSSVTCGIAPNRRFVVTYDAVAMFSCTTLEFTNQLVLYETSNRIEMHITSKPLCTTWNGGAAIQGLENIDGTVGHIVPGRNFPTQWSVNNDGYEFVPDGIGGYTINAIPYDPEPVTTNNNLIWYDNQGNTNLGTTNTITVSPNVATWYYCEWDYPCNNEPAIDSILVTLGNVDITAEATDASCFGYSDGYVVVDPIGSNYPVSISVANSNGAQIQQINNVFGIDTLGGLGAGNAYSVTVTDQVGCQTSLNFNIGEPTQLVPNARHTDILCNGDDNGTAAASPSGSVPPYQLQWSDPLQQTTDSISFLPPGAYTLTVTDAQGCVADTTFSVIEPLPLILDMSSGADTCLYTNGAVRAEMQGGVTPYEYTWDNLGGDSANFSMDEVGYAWSLLENLSHGEYAVLVTDSNGCTIEGSIEVDLINPPIASFLSRSKPVEFTDPEVQFVNESSAALTYEWHFGDGTISYEEDPEHSYDTSGVFLVMLIAQNEPNYGCADTTFRYMEVDPLFTFYVPNAFTPDGDGLNDTWGPMGQSFEYESYNAKVFDRWGKLIWQTDNPYKYWDGNFMGSGEEVKQGMYVYTFELKKFNTFEPKIITGTVTLYRHN
ncbi:MAG: gliding motility-associated C-terminal domain-containing protein [Flavobacteriales bacterium]|nr:gliding motility-associated C-terminal domain-containing protein [Flavobacteriales bacterium]MCB9204708.1 gliding motility-associated C-terminal domain-containing protein [Flavobacteriales bacterium]